MQLVSGESPLRFSRERAAEGASPPTHPRGRDETLRQKDAGGPTSGESKDTEGARLSDLIHAGREGDLSGSKTGANTGETWRCRRRSALGEVGMVYETLPSIIVIAA